MKFPGKGKVKGPYPEIWAPLDLIEFQVLGSTPKGNRNTLARPQVTSSGGGVQSISAVQVKVWEDSAWLHLLLETGLLTCSYKRGVQNPNLETNKIRKVNTMMRPTVEVETSHRLFSAPRGDTVGSGLKRWAIQVKQFLTVWWRWQPRWLFPTISRTAVSNKNNLDRWRCRRWGWNGGRAAELKRSQRICSGV